MSEVVAEGRFKSSETTGAKGGGTRTFLGAWFLACLAILVSLLLGALWMPLLYIGLIVAALIMLGGFVALVKGVKDFYRSGACPHCSTPVKVIAQPERAKTCPGCKHRLILRGNRLHDVSTAA